MAIPAPRCGLTVLFCARIHNFVWLLIQPSFQLVDGQTLCFYLLIQIVICAHVQSKMYMTKRLLPMLEEHNIACVMCVRKGTTNRFHPSPHSYFISRALACEAARVGAKGLPFDQTQTGRGFVRLSCTTAVLLQTSNLPVLDRIFTHVPAEALACCLLDPLLAFGSLYLVCSPEYHYTGCDVCHANSPCWSSELSPRSSVSLVMAQPRQLGRTVLHALALHAAFPQPALHAPIRMCTHPCPPCCL